MSTTGRGVFDQTLRTTNIWLNEVLTELGPDRQLAWQILGAVLRGLRDQLPIMLVAHLGSQLPTLIRGTYYDQWTPRDKPLELRSRDDFLHHVCQSLGNTRPVNVSEAVQVVFRTISKHVTEGQVEKIRDCLPRDLAMTWPQDATGREKVVAHQPSVQSSLGR